MEKIKVDGFKNLYRDPSSGAIINSSVDEYEKYMKSKRNREELYGAVQEINALKEEMNELKSLIRELINRNGN